MDMISELGSELYIKCRSINVNVVYASETSAELLYLTSYNGKLKYIGNKSYECDELECISEVLNPRDIVIVRRDIKLLNTLSTFCSLIEYSFSDWGLRGIIHFVTLVPQKRWRDELRIRGLYMKFKQHIDDALELDLIDRKQYESLTAIRPWANYDMTRFGGNNDIIYSEDW